MKKSQFFYFFLDKKKKETRVFSAKIREFFLWTKKKKTRVSVQKSEMLVLYEPRYFCGAIRTLRCSNFGHELQQAAHW